MFPQIPTMKTQRHKKTEREPKQKQTLSSCQNHLEKNTRTL